MIDKLKVLLVEDSPDDAELVMRFVRKCAKEVSFERVQTESELSRSCGVVDWDIVLSDFNLPQFSGLDAIRVVREQKLEAPLILVSGTIGEEIAVEALKAGAADYVLKSNLGRLATAIEHALRAKKSEVENRQLVRQLEQAQKMEAVGRLAGGIAHDVNNALAAITIYAETAIEQIDLSDWESAKRSLEGILNSQKSATGIIRQLLSFSRKKIGTVVTVDFGAVLERVRPLIKTLMGSHIEFKVNGPSRPILIEADPIQIEQIVMNLAVNAKDAMENVGQFTLSLSECTIESPPLDARLPVGAGEYACLSARDTGCGIPPEIQDKIFEPFFTTKEIGKGTGLGLPVVYGIIKQAKGTLWVESQPGTGTEFKLLWPKVNETGVVEDKLQPTQGVPRALKTGGHVLLVEDESSFRRALAMTLKNHNFNVLEAVNGAEALKLAQERVGPIDLLISDVVMPEMGGPQLANTLRLAAPQLRVLFLSGYTDDTFEEFIADRSSTWFLQKPFTTKAFLAKIAEIFPGENK